MAKKIIYPTNENEILAGETRYTKTEHGITDWDEWSVYGTSISALNPLSDSELLLHKRKTEYEQMKKALEPLSFNAELPAMQVTKWIESDHKSYFTQAFPLSDTSIHINRWKIGVRYFSKLVKYLKNHTKGNDSMIYFLNDNSILTWFEMSFVDSEISINNSKDSFFCHSYLRCAKKIEICSLVNSEVENVNLHNKKLFMENSKIRNVDYNGEIYLKNSELDNTTISIKSNDYAMTNRITNIKLLHCRILAHKAIDYRSEKGLILENVIIYDFRTSNEEIVLTKEMVIDNVIILGK